MIEKENRLSTVLIVILAVLLGAMLYDAFTEPRHALADEFEYTIEPNEGNAPLSFQIHTTNPDAVCFGAYDPSGDMTSCGYYGTISESSPGYHYMNLDGWYAEHTGEDGNPYGGYGTYTFWFSDNDHCYLGDGEFLSLEDCLADENTVGYATLEFNPPLPPEPNGDVQPSGVVWAMSALSIMMMVICVYFVTFFMIIGLIFWGVLQVLNPIFRLIAYGE